MSGYSSKQFYDSNEPWARESASNVTDVLRELRVNMPVAHLTRRDQLGQKQLRFLVWGLHCGEYGDCVTPFSLVYGSVVCTFLPDCTALRPRTAMIFHFFVCLPVYCESEGNNDWDIPSSVQPG